MANGAVVIPQMLKWKSGEFRPDTRPWKAIRSFHDRCAGGLPRQCFPGASPSHDSKLFQVQSDSRASNALPEFESNMAPAAMLTTPAGVVALSLRIGRLSQNCLEPTALNSHSCRGSS